MSDFTFPQIFLATLCAEALR